MASNESNYPKATNANHNDDDKACESSEKQKVDQFLVSGIRSGASKLSLANLKIELLSKQHGLFDLVQLVFVEGFNKFNLTSDCYYSHLWELCFDNKIFEYRSEFEINRIDEENVRILNDLELKEGEKGFFTGRSGSFEIKVIKIEDLSDETELKEYPKVKEVPYGFSSTLDSSFLSDAQKADALRLRTGFKQYYEGENEWRIDRDTFDYVPRKPQAPTWSPNERELMGLLIQSGHKFKKSWENILQYAFVNRAETAASGQWYQLKKDSWLQYVGENLKSNKDRMLAAKSICLRMLERHVDQGVPELGENPDKHIERKLIQKGRLDPNESPASKRIRISQFRHMPLDEF